MNKGSVFPRKFQIVPRGLPFVAKIRPFIRLNLPFVALRFAVRIFLLKFNSFPTNLSLKEGMRLVYGENTLHKCSYTCIARKPRCGSCIIEDLCEYKEKVDI